MAKDIVTQIEYKTKDAPTIEILETLHGNDSGDVVKVRMETSGEIYYYDGYRRWCYLLKSEEGTLWKWKNQKSRDAKL